MENLVWVTINLEDGNRVAYSGNLAMAKRVAAALVGNNSFAGPMGDIYLYGPGDGNTSVMVRQLPSELIQQEARFVRAGHKLLAACKAVANDLHNGEDGLWRAGPWADPKTEDGAGGTVQMIREAVEDAEND